MYKYFNLTISCQRFKVILKRKKEMICNTYFEKKLFIFSGRTGQQSRKRPEMYGNQRNDIYSRKRNDFHKRHSTHFKVCYFSPDQKGEKRRENKTRHQIHSQHIPKRHHFIKGKRQGFHKMEFVNSDFVCALFFIFSCTLLI